MHKTIKSKSAQEVISQKAYKTAKIFPTINPVCAAECVLFCAEKTHVISNWSGLFRSHMLWSCQFRVGVLNFAQLPTFVVYSVTNSSGNARKNVY